MESNVDPISILIFYKNFFNVNVYLTLFCLLGGTDYFIAFFVFVWM